MLFKLFRDFICFIHALLNQNKKEILENMSWEDWNNIWIYSELTGEIGFAQQYDNDKYRTFLRIGEEDGYIYEVLYNFIHTAERVEKIEYKYYQRPDYISKLEVLNNET